MVLFSVQHDPVLARVPVFGPSPSFAAIKVGPGTIWRAGGWMANRRVRLPHATCEPASVGWANSFI